MKLKRLVPGDVVGIIAPAAAILNGDERLILLEKKLSRLGLKVKYGRTIGQKLAYLAGHDELRTSDLMSMFEDNEVNAILAMLGGYGCSRIVDKLDYSIIKKNPKLLIGFSDITVLLNSIYKHTNIPTVHGPVGIYLSKSTFDEASFEDFSNILFNNQLGRILKNPKEDAKTLVGGIVKGKLVGGNLSLVSNLIGTPYEIDVTNKILFIEEVDEQPYQIDRFFSNLRLSGVLEKAKGFVFGYFTNCHPKEENSWDYVELIKQYFSNLNKPVIYDFASGHDLPFVSLPIGIEVELDANNKTIKIMEEIYETN